jgi:hypothetical protein
MDNLRNVLEGWSRQQDRLQPRMIAMKEELGPRVADVNYGQSVNDRLRRVIPAHAVD